MNITKTEKIQLLIKAVACALVLSAAMSLASFEESCGKIRENVLRLHIKANSDSAVDQNLKLSVRDAVLVTSEAVFSECSSLEEAYTAASDNVEKFKETAQNTVNELGFDYPVSVSIGEAWFETREYESFTLPAGNYEAVRINIGEGKGQNWWCVMFPTLCIPSAKPVDVGENMDDDCEKIVTEPERYEVRFKAVERYERIKSGIIRFLGL